MFENVLVGVDGQEGGRDAIALARKLVGGDGKLTLAHLYIGDTVPWRGSGGAFDAARHQRGLALLTAARDEAGVEAELVCIGSSSVGRGLHLLAESPGADLLVVGSSRRGLLGRVLLGDDTRASLNGAPCAVAIAPAGYCEHESMMREIGVGYDGSPESEHALAVARKLAAQHGSTLSAFQAVALPRYMFVGGPAPIAETLEDFVDEARGRIAALGGVEAHAAYGHPAEELALYGASLDLLVVGSRSYGPLGRLVHGSTSLELAHSARCPLLVLTRAARAEDQDDALVGASEGARAG
jgi:nucleotide-binding universal stress UspA family protein